jgi:pantothenate kinase
VIVEGNYLLLDCGPWSELRDLLDEVWYVDVDRAVRLDRLISRHVAFGKAPEAARAWSEGPDEANATVVDSARGRADLIVTLPSG